VGPGEGSKIKDPMSREARFGSGVAAFFRLPKKSPRLGTESPLLLLFSALAHQPLLAVGVAVRACWCMKA
jgi:hypothetical protein